MLVVVAHPDDESFGLGAAISTLTDSGSSVAVLCFTHGEASTLGEEFDDLGRIRADELAAAARVLDIDVVELLDYHDAHLAEVSFDALSACVRASMRRASADLLLVFDQGGITGHPDHCRATEVAIKVAREVDLPVLAWALRERVAVALNEEFSAGFVGRQDEELDFEISVGRTRQHQAIREHASQCTDNPVLVRRLSLQGAKESFRWL